MTPLPAVATQTLIQQLSEKSGLEEEIIKQKMMEKVEKFSGLLTEQGALVLLSNDLRVRLPVMEKNNATMKLGELKPGMNNIDVQAHVNIIDRIKPYSKNGKEGKYLSLRLSDDTGEALFTFWNEHAEEALQKGIQKGSKISLTNARVGSFNQLVQLSLGYNGNYTIENTPNKEKENTLNDGKKDFMPFNQLTENQPIEGNAHVIKVLLGKGYYVRCLNCNGKLQKRESTCPICMTEGKIETRLLVPVLLDDGTKPVRAVAFEKEVISLYEKTKEELLRAFETDKAMTDRELLGKRVEIQGRTKLGMDKISLEIVLSKATRVPFTQA